jgi:hypothetical protein
MSKRPAHEIEPSVTKMASAAQFGDTVSMQT